jgi:hypothetical protein
MGGSDAQLVKRDPATDSLYLTLRCVGNHRGPIIVKESPDRHGPHHHTGRPTLGSFLNMTLVARSTDKGATWKSLGYMDGVDYIRTDVVPMATNKAAFTSANYVVVGSGSPGKFKFGSAQSVLTAGEGFGWINSTWQSEVFEKNEKYPYIAAGSWANTVSARAPDAAGMVIAFPTILTDTAGIQTNGYDVVFYDPAKPTTAEEYRPVAPLNYSHNGAIMHLTTIDPGQGPILLYWADVDGKANTMRVRGRIITGPETSTKDFDISPTYDLTVKGYWYGDYWTASGFARTLPTPGKWRQRNLFYYFYPTWVDSDGTGRFAEIEVEVTQTGATSPKAPGLAMIMPHAASESSECIELSNRIAAVMEQGGTAQEKEPRAMEQDYQNKCMNDAVPAQELAVIRTPPSRRAVKLPPPVEGKALEGELPRVPQGWQEEESLHQAPR